MGHRSVSATVGRRRRLGLLLATLGFFVLPAYVRAATPTITNVSGTIASGQTLTVTGANMVDENQANWYYDSGSFEGANAAADGFGCSGGSCPYDSNVKLMGSKSFRSDLVPGGGGTCTGMYAFTGDELDSNTGASPHKFMRIYTRYNDAMLDAFEVTYYMKRFFYAPTGSSLLEHNGTSGWPTDLTLFMNGNSVSVSLPEQVKPNKWYSYEMEIDCTNSIMRAWVDGVHVGAYSNSCFNGNPWNLEVGITNACATGSFPMGGSIYHDGLAEGTTRVYPAAIIEVSDNANYAAGNRVIQAPIALGDISIQFAYATSGHDLSGVARTLTGTDRYLWITNNRQERSAAYPLGGADTTPPSAPSGLGVQ